MRARRRLSPLLALALIACADADPRNEGGGGGGGGAGGGGGGSEVDGGGPADEADFVGTVGVGRLVIESEGSRSDVATAYASFFDPYDYDTGPLPEVDACARQDAGSAPVPAIRYRDAGPTVTLVPAGGGADLVLDRVVNGGSLFYQPAELPLPAERVEPGERYEVAWQGTEELAAGRFAGDEALSMTASLALLGPLAGEVLLGVVSVEWSGSLDPARTLTLSVTGYDAGRGESVSYLCRVRDDGDFELDAALVEALPSGPITLSLTRLESHEVALEGERIALTGSYGHSVTATKP